MGAKVDAATWVLGDPVRYGHADHLHDAWEDARDDARRSRGRR
jgi:hypothetical protein